MAGRAQYSSGAGSSANTAVERWIGPYKRLESIGKGSFAVVFKGIHPADGSLLAIKSIQHTLLKGKLKGNLMSEIEIMRKAHHPHIVGLLEVLETPHNIHLVMEFCSLGDLAAFVKKRDKLNVHPATADLIRNYPNPLHGGFNEVVVRHFAKQLASALEYLIERGLVHRDLKPQNLLLVSPPSTLHHEPPENRPYQIRENPLIPKAGIESMPCLKIADFGFARHLPQTTLAETLCGSPLYMAPEILRYEKYDNKSDLWSVGIVLYELAVGKPPFKGSNHVDLLRRIEMNMDRIEFPDNIPISIDMKIVIRGLLKKQPTERISWENFFMSGIISKDIPGLLASDRPKRKDPVRNVVRDEARDVVREESRDTVREDIRDAVRESARPVSGRRVSAGQAGLETKANTVSAAPSLGNRQYSASSFNPVARETPPSSASLQRYPASGSTPTSHQSRPAMTSHATAPVGKLTRPGSYNPEVPRRRSQLSGLQDLYPTSSTQARDDFNRGRYERSARETRERAAHDVAFERDYVIVEKRAVEVNALADEMAATPHVVRGSYPSRRGVPRESEPSPLLRRATAQSSPKNNNNFAPSSSYVAPKSDRPTQQRPPSYERRYNPGQGKSNPSALTAAINLVQMRIHGAKNMEELNSRDADEPIPYPVNPVFPGDANAYAILKAERPKLSKDEECLERAIAGANRHDIVYRMAEVKYLQLLPLPPSASSTALERQETAVAGASNNTATSDGNRLTKIGPRSSRNSTPPRNFTSPRSSPSPNGSATVSPSPSDPQNANTTPSGATQADQAGEAQPEEDAFPLTPEAIVTVSEEGISLYAKSVQILENVMDLCGTWYKAHYNGPPPRQFRETPQRVRLSDSWEARELNCTFIIDEEKFADFCANNDDTIPTQTPVDNPFLDHDINDDHDVVATDAPVIDATTNEFTTFSEAQNVTTSDNTEIGTSSVKAKTGKAKKINTFDNEGGEAVIQDTPEEARLAIEAHNRVLKEMKAVMFWCRKQYNQATARLEFCYEKWSAARLIVAPSNTAHPSNDRPNGPLFSNDVIAEDLIWERARSTFITTLRAERLLGVPNSTFREMLMTYKSVACMLEAILEGEGGTWEESKEEKEKKAAAVKKTPAGQETVVCWKYPNDQFLSLKDIEKILAWHHDANMRLVYIKEKMRMREEIWAEEKRRGGGAGPAGRA